jgi:hypothetical protein
MFGRVGDQHELADSHRTGGEIDGLAGPGQVIGAFAGDLDRREDWRALQYRADEAWQHGP